MGIFARIAFLFLLIPHSIFSSTHLIHVNISEDETTLPQWHREPTTRLECVQLTFTQEGRTWSTFADMRTPRHPHPVEPPQWWKEPPDTLGAYAIDVQLEKGPLRPGNCTLTASRWGFVPQSQQVELRSDAQSDIEFVLARDPNFNLIVTPRWMTAETVLPAETFRIEANAPPNAMGWRAWLKSSHFSRDLIVQSATYGEKALRHRAEAGWNILVQLPEDTPEDIYALHLGYSGGESIQPNAVRVWKAMPDPFYIVGNFHHAFDNYNIRADGEIARLFEQTVNVISPVFYANVDDIGYEDERLWGRISYAVERYLRVPYFHGLGNHDRGASLTLKHYPHRPWPDEPLGIEYYRYYAGMRYQSRDFGATLHVVLPYCPDQFEALQVRPDQDMWLKDDLRQASTSGLRLLTCHHLTRFRSEPGPGPWEYTDLLNPEYGLNLVLFERGLRDTVAAGSLPTYYGGLCRSETLDMVGVLEITKLAPNDPRLQKTVLSTEPPARADVRVVNGDTLRTFPRLPSSDVYVSKGYLIRDVSMRAFSTEYSGPNDGSQASLTARINRAEDDNPLVIRGGSLRFVMQKGVYRASIGEIVQQVDSDNGKATIVDVRVDVGPGLTQVTVKKG